MTATLPIPIMGRIYKIRLRVAIQQHSIEPESHDKMEPNDIPTEVFFFTYLAQLPNTWEWHC